MLLNSLLFIYLLATNSIYCVHCGYVPDIEINALWDLYNSTNGTFWHWKSLSTGVIWNFNSSPLNPCSPVWQGIICSSCSLDSDVCNILNVSLVDYNLEGSIPSSIASFEYLNELNLNTNKLNGSIPTTLNKLTELSYLVLYSNLLTGSIPSSLCELSSLQGIFLFYNSISGSIPVNIGQITSLVFLHIFGNRLTGLIPTSLGELQYLQDLRLYYNSISGSIPVSFANLTVLKVLYINSNSLTGTLPSGIGLLSALIEINLCVNRFSGVLTDWLGPINYFNVYSNHFTGTLPLFEHVNAMQYLLIYINYLTGTIPEQYGEMKYLQYLTLYSNSLTGSIPLSISNLTELLFLDIHDNALSSSIPSSLANIRSLVYLDLSKNGLSGNIPRNFGQFSSLYFSNIEKNYFSGQFPIEACQLFYESNNIESNTADILSAVIATDSGIDCYPPSCLSSYTSYVFEGIETCPGNVLRRFLAGFAVVVGFTMFCAVLWWYFVRKPSENSITMVEMTQNPISKSNIDPSCARNSTCADLAPTLMCAKDTQVTPSFLDKALIRFSDISARFAVSRVLALSLGKLFLVIIVSFFYEQGFQYCFQSKSDEIIDQCFSINLNGCSQLCGDVAIRYISDEVDDQAYLPPVAKSLSFCEATFSGRCACTQWKAFVLVPLLLNVLHCIIQLCFFFVFKRRNPQSIHYTWISDYMNGRPNSSNGVQLTFYQLIQAVTNGYAILPMLECSTVLLVWLSVVFPPVLCDEHSAIPTSYFYYPLLMTIFEFGRLNLFMGTELKKWYQQGRFRLAMLTFFNLQIFAMSMLVTTIQAVYVPLYMFYGFILMVVKVLKMIVFKSSRDVSK